MDTPKEINQKAKHHRELGDLETAGMLEHLYQLKTSWIPQVTKALESGGYTFVQNAGGGIQPHTIRPPKLLSVLEDVDTELASIEDWFKGEEITNLRKEIQKWITERKYTSKG